MSKQEASAEMGQFEKSWVLKGKCSKRDYMSQKNFQPMPQAKIKK